ncbi:unnamed protein product [Cunninghamella echinulata]
MFNNLKRRYSIDESDKGDFNKRPKVLSDIPLPETYNYTNLYSNPITHPTQLPPSPPVINDPSIPASITCSSSSSSSSIDTIPTLKRFTISTRQQQQQQEYDPTDITSAYTDINNLLYQLHLERYSENNHNNNQQDIDMMGDNNNDNEMYQYNMVNAILRQAFLERHPISK